jgi:cell fate regulator YaaT (PSP1 superfamily)
MGLSDGTGSREEAIGRKQAAGPRSSISASCLLPPASCNLPPRSGRAHGNFADMGGCGSGGGCGVGNAYNPGQYVGIRINEHEDGRNVLCDTMGVEVSRGQRVIVEADSGMEYAEVTNLRPMILKQCQLRDSRRLVRVASDTDLASYEAKVGRESRFLSDTQALATEKRLAIKVVRAEETFDGRKVTVYYTSETRIDYRRLVSELALKHPVRIEMRQIGPRDETKIRGGIGPCGLTLCCSTFLRSFHPVTIKMAKNQNLSLNPSKISGMCGRLMCCLAYEDEGPAIQPPRKQNNPAELPV